MIHRKSGPDPLHKPNPYGPKPAVLVRRGNGTQNTAAGGPPPLAPADVEDEDADAVMTGAAATSAANDLWRKHNDGVLTEAIGASGTGDNTHGTAEAFRAAMVSTPLQGALTLPAGGSAQGSMIADLIPRMPVSMETTLITTAFNKVADKSRIRPHPCDVEPTYATIALCVADAWEEEEPSAFLLFPSPTTDPLSAPISLSCTMNGDTNKVIALAEHHRDQHALARYFARAPPEVQTNVLQTTTVEEAAYALAEAAKTGTAARTVLMGVFARRFMTSSPRWGNLLT